MFKVIVWATDGSSGAEQSLPLAKGLAQAHGARLVVVHVNEFTIGRGAYPVNLTEEEVLAAVQKQVEILKQAGLDATLQRANVTAGGAAHVIAAIAKNQGGSDRGGNARLRPHRRAAVGQRHASSAAHRALPGAGRPSRGRCLHVDGRHASRETSPPAGRRRASGLKAFIALTPRAVGTGR
jgi:hypothetical protein